MKHMMLTPSKEPHNNAKLLGGENAVDLHITKYNYEDGSEAFLSVWRIKSFWQRLKFLFDGRINLAIMGKTAPPMFISVGEIDFLKPTKKGS